MQVLDQQLYWKRKFSTGAFLWTLRNFSEHLFYRTPPSNCFRIFGHHHEDLYFCGKFSCNTKLPVQYQPNISASKIVIVKAELLLRPFFKANSLLKIGRLRHINFSSRFINGCGGKKNLETTSAHLQLLDHFVLFKSSPPKFFSKVAVLNVLKNSLENEDLR